jgi:hypothetical protein
MQTTWEHAAGDFDDFLIGDSGSATLAISGGASLSNGSVILGNQPGGDGHLTIAGTGSLLSATDVQNGAGGTGRITLDGGSIGASTVHVGNGRLEGSGLVTANVVNAGRVAPGTSSVPLGQINVEGDFFQEPGGTIEIEIGAAGSDLLSISGVAVLDGTLEVTLDAGFTPAPGSSLVVVDYGELATTFAMIDTPALEGDLTLAAVYGLTELSLVATLPGDANLDFAVDRADAAVVLKHLGLSAGATFEQGDFDGDGAVGLADLALLQAYFGQSVVLSPSAQAVPEPGCAWLLLAGWFFLPRQRRAAGSERSQEKSRIIW